MTGNQDPFHLVKEWWGDRPVESDTVRFGIDPSTKEGAFESLIQGVLYAIDDTGPDVQDTFDALRENGLTNLDTLAGMDDDRWHTLVRNKKDVDALASLVEDSANGTLWVIFLAIWSGHYFGGRHPRKTSDIVRAAVRIHEHSFLQGDLRKLPDMCHGDRLEMFKWLDATGLGKKRFWLMREMRMRGVWDIDGRYCCVPDNQVGKSLERWGKISEYKTSLKPLMECSALVWDGLGEQYDLPVLHYARQFQCNDARSRRCGECAIEKCRDRNQTDSLEKWG